MEAQCPLPPSPWFRSITNYNLLLKTKQNRWIGVDDFVYKSYHEGLLSHTVNPVSSPWGANLTIWHNAQTTMIRNNAQIMKASLGPLFGSTTQATKDVVSKLKKLKCQTTASINTYQIIVTRYNFDMRDACHYNIASCTFLMYLQHRIILI